MRNAHTDILWFQYRLWKIFGSVSVSKSGTGFRTKSCRFHVKNSIVIFYFFAFLDFCIPFYVGSGS
jgi:hypothetical protein